MEPFMNSEKFDWPRLLKQIKETDQTEVEKLAQAFGFITRRIMDYTHQEIELARAMQDKDTLIKHQIKVEVMKNARSIFHDCYKQILGRKAWHE